MSAKEETSDYKLDPNYAVVCSFLEKFGKILYEDPAHLCIENLDSFLVLDSVPKDHGFLKLHMKLLKGIGSKAQYEKWERGFMKFSEDFPERDDKLIEEHGYGKIPVAAKLRILKNLFEDQFEFNNGFNVKVHNLLAEEDELRHLPLGMDKQGRSYWYIMDKLGSMRLYRSMTINSTGKETWTLVCSEVDELKQLIESLQSYEEKDEKEDPILEEQEKIPSDKLSFKTDFLKITDDEIEEFLSETKRPFPIYYKIPKARSLKQIKIDETKHSLKHCFIKVGQADSAEVEKWQEKEKEKVEESKSEPIAADGDNQEKSNLESKSKTMDNAEPNTKSVEIRKNVEEKCDKMETDQETNIPDGDKVDTSEKKGTSEEDEKEIKKNVKEKCDNIETDQKTNIPDGDKVDISEKKGTSEEDVKEKCEKMETDQETNIPDGDKVDISEKKGTSEEDAKEIRKNVKEKCDKMEIDRETNIQDDDKVDINEKKGTSEEDEKEICDKMEIDIKENDDKPLPKFGEKNVKTPNEKEIVKVVADGHETRNQTSEKMISKENIKNPKDHSSVLDVNDDLKTDQFEDDLDMKETLMRISELSGSFSGQFSKSDKDSDNNKISDKNDEVTGIDKSLTIDASVNQSELNLTSENGSVTESEKTCVPDEGSNDKKAFDDAIKDLMTLEGIINQGKTILSSGMDEEADLSTDNIVSCTGSSEHSTDLPSVTLVSDIGGKENIINGKVTDIKGKENIMDEEGDNKCRGKTTEEKVGGKISDKKGDETDGENISDIKSKRKESDQVGQLKISDEKEATINEEKEEGKLSDEREKRKISDKKKNETSPLIGNNKLDINEFQRQDNIEKKEGIFGNVLVKQELKDMPCASTFGNIISILNGNKSSVNVNDGIQVKLEKEGTSSLNMNSDPSQRVQREIGSNAEQLRIEDNAMKKELQIKLERIDEIFNRKKLDMEKDLKEFIEYEMKNIKYNSVNCGKDSEELNGKVTDSRCKEEFTKMFESYDKITSQTLESLETRIHVNGDPRGIQKQEGNSARSQKLAQKFLVDGDVIEINELSSDESGEEPCLGFERNKHLAKQALKVMNNRKYVKRDPYHSRTYNKQARNESGTKKPKADRKKVKHKGINTTAIVDFNESGTKKPKADRKKEIQHKGMRTTPIVDFSKPSFMNGKDKLQVFKLGPNGLVPQPTKIDLNRIPSHEFSPLYPSPSFVQKQPVQYIQYLNPTGIAPNIVYMTPTSLIPGNVIPGVIPKSGSSVTPTNAVSAPNVLKMLSGKVVQPGNSASTPHMMNLLPGNIVKLSNSGSTPNVMTLLPGSVVPSSAIPHTFKSNENMVLTGKLMTSATSSVVKPKVAEVTLDETKQLQPKSIVIPTNPVTRSLLSDMNVKIMPKQLALQSSLVNIAPKSVLPGQPGIIECANQPFRYNVQHPTKNKSVFQGPDGQFFEKGTGRTFNVPQNGRRVALGLDKRFYDCHTGEVVNVNVASHLISSLKPGMSFLLVPSPASQPADNSFLQSEASKKKQKKSKEIKPMLMNKAMETKLANLNIGRRKFLLRQKKKMILIDESDSSDNERYEDSDGNSDCDRDDVDADVDIDSDYDYDSISRRVREAVHKQLTRPAKKPNYIEISEEEIDVEEMEEGTELPDRTNGRTPDVIEVSDEEIKIKARKKAEQFELGEYPCTICETSSLPPTILTCDDCDSTYHMGCLTPPLLHHPEEEWFCPLCEHEMLVNALQIKYKELRRMLYSANRKKDKISTNMFAINRENIMGVSRSVRTRKEVDYDETKFDKMVKNAVKEINNPDDKKSTKRSSAKSSMKDSDESDNHSTSDDELMESPCGKEKEKKAPYSRAGRIRKEVNYDDAKFDERKSKKGSAKSRIKDSDQSDESDNSSSSDIDPSDSTNSSDDIKNESKGKEKSEKYLQSRSSRNRKEVNYDETKTDKSVKDIKRSDKKKKKTTGSAKSRMKDDDNSSASDNELSDSAEDIKNEEKKTAPAQNKSVKNNRLSRTGRKVNYNDTKLDNKRSSKGSAKSSIKDSDESNNSSASDNEQTDSPDVKKNLRKQKERTVPALTKSLQNSRSSRTRKEVNYDEAKFDKIVKNAVKDMNKSDKKKSTRGSAKSSIKDSDESNNSSASDNEQTDSPDDKKNLRKQKERTVPAQTKSVQNSRSSRSHKEVNYDEAKFDKIVKNAVKDMNKSDKKKSTRGSAKSRMNDSDESGDNYSASDNELTDSSEDNKKEGKEEKKAAPPQTKSVKNNRSGRSRKGVIYDETKFDEIGKSVVKDINKSDKKKSNKCEAKSRMKNLEDSDIPSESDDETDSPGDSKKVKRKEKSRPSETKSAHNVRKRSHRHTELTDTNDTEPTKRKVKKLSDSNRDSTDRKSVEKGNKHSEKKKNSKGSTTGRKEKRRSLENRDERHIRKLRDYVPADGDSDYSMPDADQKDSDSNSDSGDQEDYGDGIDTKKDPEHHIYYTSSGRKTNSLAKLKDAF